MIEVDFTKVEQAFINNGVAAVKREDKGLVLTEDMICDYNAVVVLNHMRFLYYDEMTEEQRKNVSVIYNRLIV